MWRLKIAGQASGGPWLQSANGFLGRQVWEFDRDAGSPEERAEVERLREDFTKHRSHKRESQDLLLRLQFAKGTATTCTRTEKGAQVTEKMITTSLRRALNQYSALQAHDGHWPGDLSGILFIMPMLIFSLYVTRSLNMVLSSEHQHEICRHIYNHQNEDGGWGTHIWGPSNMLGSCLNYAALRLLVGETLDNDNDVLIKARAWILSHGSATAVPQWGKIFLSILGVYDWSGNNPIIPELWLLPHFLPIHPGRFWCFCRLVYMSMAYLYGKKFVGLITPTITALREELYNTPYSNIDWGKVSNCCAEEDLHNPRSQVRNIVLVCLKKFVEPMLNWWPTNKLRGRALSKLMEQIHYNNETTEYITICPVDKALNMICCWVENPNSDAFKKHLPRVYDYLWIAEDGMKAKIYDGCQNWETPFIVQAMCSTNLINEFGPTIKKAHDFMKKSQVLRNLPDYERFYRHRSKGSWTLSTIDNGWPISDGTAETLKNKDGSICTYERRRTATWVELLNPSESFKNIVIDHPTSECTASVIDGMVLFKELYPQYRSEEVGNCIKNAVKYVEGKQLKDGSWYGSWGICFTYGTMFAVKGLGAAGRNYYNSSSIRKACKFLLSKQQSTGGWGESYLSNYTEEYVDSGTPHTVETAWAMLGLIYGGQAEIDPVPLYRAAQVLMSMQLETGEFPQQEHAGCANSAFYFNYPNYRNLFPIMALGEFRRRLVANKN
ncbi:achilleol B synthase isoform X2 [Triticum aestivum]|nr:achilleol B synthase-like isoform X2 [Triticum aestivum]